MFQRIKNIFSGIGLAVKYGDVVRSITSAYANYPGLEDADLLRLWVRPLLTDASTLSALTQTTVDDFIVDAAIKIVDNNHAWSAVHSLAMLAHYGLNIETALVPGDSGDMFDTLRKVADETVPECPSAVLTAIGIILFLLQRRSNKS